MRPQTPPRIRFGFAFLFGSLLAAPACDVEDPDGLAVEDDDEGFELRVWTGITSEEYPPITCGPGMFARSFECFGSYCDNIRMDCGSSSASHGFSSWTSYFSEEGSGSADERICSLGEFVTGIQCDDSYCDNISIQCTEAAGKTSSEDCGWTGWYSEEHGPSEPPPEGSFITGIECDGSNCDKKRYRHCPMIDA